MRNRFIIFFILLLSCNPNVFSISGDSTQVSLLTVYPRSTEVYTMFGHTAIRVYNPSEKIDTVFNYGMFDFKKPNFIYRYIKGETDYYLVATGYQYFKYAYSLEGATVQEQVLNIPSREKELLFGFLLTNLQPENIEYRYNNFFDNCTTKPRDLIEKYCGGTLTYMEPETKTTFRNLVHKCTGDFTWLTFGIDLVIGNGADSLISFHEEMFLPVRLMNGLDSGVVLAKNGEKTPIVISSQTIVKPAPEEIQTEGGFNFSPLVCSIVLLGLTIGFAIVAYIKGRKFRLFFGLLFLVATLGGCIVCFMTFCSTQPCTSPNFHVFWLHPLYLIAAIGCCLKKTYQFITWFHWSNFVLLSVFLILWKILPQEMDVACVPFAMCLWIGSGLQLFSKKK